MSLARAINDPTEQFKVKPGHDEDVRELEKLIRLMPEAFLYDYDRVEGDLVRLKFRPNSNDSPLTYEAR